MVTVKKDRSVKIALDARVLNHAIDKDKHQMSNLESLVKFREVFDFIDDISIVTKRTENHHLDKVREIMKIDNAELQLKAGKCKIEENEIEWLVSM